MSQLFFARRRLAIVCFGVACTSICAQDQADFGDIRGSITDRSGGAIVGASIRIQKQGRREEQTVHTDQAGRFTFLHLSSGHYKIVVHQPGFPDSNAQVDLAPGAKVQLPVTLALGSILESITVQSEAPPVMESPTAQTLTSVGREEFKDTPAFSIAELMALAPGVTTRQGNGPRDVSISIRGSNDRQSFAIRNAQIFEDGFPVTQPGGLARTDLTDPHAYSVVDIVQGPSSSLYGNFATGGAINFRTRSGNDLHGLEVGADFGSFGYYNDYLTFGGGSDRAQYSVFLSNVRSNGFITNNAFNTITANLLGSFRVTARDRVTLKFINNDLDTELPIRLSLNQYRANPYQAGCQSTGVQGCASVSLFANGFNGATQSATASQAGLGRNDRRTIVGARWEHSFSDSTSWRTQFVFDNRSYNQPTSNMSARGTVPSFNVMSDVTRRGSLFGFQTTTFGGIFFNFEDNNGQSYNVAPGGNAQLGALTQNVTGRHTNTGLRGRVEINLHQKLTAVLGVGGEYSSLDATQTIYRYPPGAVPATTRIPANRPFFNIAPEAAVLYRPAQSWRFHSRIGTGYGTPQISNLFVTPQGVFGNNTQLKPQRNVGVDVGAQWTPHANLSLSATGFYERMYNELLTQSAGINLQSYTFNAPRSIHRGVEIGADVRPLGGLLPGARVRVAYLYNDQIYAQYSELLTAGTRSAVIDRKSNRIPGVVPHFLNARFAYEQPRGVLKGLGGFIESNIRASFFVDNGNLLQTPGYQLLNANVHWDPPAGWRFLGRLRFYFQMTNLTNDLWVASANNVASSLNSSTGLENGPAVLANATNSIYAGTPRASFGGIKVRF